MSKLKSLATDIAGAFERATQDVAALRERIAQKAVELRAAIQNPRPPAEVIEQVELWVDQTAAHQAREHGLHLVLSFGCAPGRERDLRIPWGFETPMTWGMACVLFGETLKTSIAQLVGDTAYEAGPATAERAAVIRRLTAELEALEAEEAAIVDEIAATKAPGVKFEFPHRPEVRERREEAQRRAEAAARAEAEQIETERRVAEWRAVGRRSARNPTIVRVP